jgi:hypothetical protein
MKLRGPEFAPHPGQPLFLKGSNCAQTAFHRKIFFHNFQASLSHAANASSCSLSDRRSNEDYWSHSCSTVIEPIVEAFNGKINFEV